MSQVYHGTRPLKNLSKAKHAAIKYKGNIYELMDDGLQINSSESSSFKWIFVGTSNKTTREVEEWAESWFGEGVNSYEGIGGQNCLTFASDLQGFLLSEGNDNWDDC